jgi:hypothetical protein
VIRNEPNIDWFLITPVAEMRFHARLVLLASRDELPWLRWSSFCSQASRELWAGAPAS